jgi:hypothetical protein
LPVALVQLDAGPDPDANVRRAAELADRAAADGARLVDSRVYVREAIAADAAPSAAVAGRP